MDYIGFIGLLIAVLIALYFGLRTEKFQNYTKSRHRHQDKVEQKVDFILVKMRDPEVKNIGQELTEDNYETAWLWESKRFSKEKNGWEVHRIRDNDGQLKGLKVKNETSDDQIFMKRKKT